MGGLNAVMSYSADLAGPYQTEQKPLFFRTGEKLCGFGIGEMGILVLQAKDQNIADDMFRMDMNEGDFCEAKGELFAMQVIF